MSSTYFRDNDENIFTSIFSKYKFKEPSLKYCFESYEISLDVWLESSCKIPKNHIRVLTS